MDPLLPKKNTKILASISKKVKMLIQRTTGQLKFPARGEELALERVVEVVVHAKQQIRTVTQTASVADVPAMK